MPHAWVEPEALVPKRIGALPKVYHVHDDRHPGTVTDYQYQVGGTVDDPKSPAWIAFDVRDLARIIGHDLWTSDEASHLVVVALAAGLAARQGRTLAQFLMDTDIWYGGG